MEIFVVTYETPNVKQERSLEFRAQSALACCQKHHPQYYCQGSDAKFMVIETRDNALKKVVIHRRKTMTDLINRLRFDTDDGARDEAADAIERLIARIAELELERNLILAALPDDYTESKDWAFDKAPVLRIDWLKSRIDNLKQERSLQDEQLDALAEKVVGN